MKKWSITKILGSVVVLCGASAAHAESSIYDALNYTTVGIWAGSPMGLSARLGAAVPINKQQAVTAGAEVGLGGNKQFVGVRGFIAAHGAAWYALDLARWQLRSNPMLGTPQTEYYGVEGQLLFFRAGVMVPAQSQHSPRVTLGVGFGF